MLHCAHVTSHLFWGPPKVGLQGEATGSFIIGHQCAFNEDVGPCSAVAEALVRLDCLKEGC